MYRCQKRVILASFPVTNLGPIRDCLVRIAFVSQGGKTGLMSTRSQNIASCRRRKVTQGIDPGDRFVRVFEQMIQCDAKRQSLGARRTCWNVGDMKDTERRTLLPVPLSPEISMTRLPPNPRRSSSMRPSPTPSSASRSDWTNSVSNRSPPSIASAADSSVTVVQRRARSCRLSVFGGSLL